LAVVVVGVMVILLVSLAVLVVAVVFQAHQAQVVLELQVKEIMAGLIQLLAHTHRAVVVGLEV
jgi:hypothetical protein